MAENTHHDLLTGLNLSERLVKALAQALVAATTEVMTGHLLTAGIAPADARTITWVRLEEAGTTVQGTAEANTPKENRRIVAEVATALGAEPPAETSFPQPSVKMTATIDELTVLLYGRIGPTARELLLDTWPARAPEYAQADAVAELAGASLARAHAQTRLRLAVADAVAAGVPTRRIREISGVSLQTIHRWTRHHPPAPRP